MVADGRFTPFRSLQAKVTMAAVKGVSRGGLGGPLDSPFHLSYRNAARFRFRGGSRDEPAADRFQGMPQQRHVIM